MMETKVAGAIEQCCRRHSATFKISYRYMSNNSEKLNRPPLYRPSNFNYNKLDKPKLREKNPWTRKAFKTQEFQNAEKYRSQSMGVIANAAKANNSTLKLKVGCVIARHGVILPDLENWEKEYLNLKQERDIFKKKTYPIDHLRMNVQKDVFSENESNEVPLPAGVEPWVYRLLSRGTDELGPFKKIENLESRLKEMEGSSKVNIESDDIEAEDRENIANDDFEGFNDADGWFEDDLNSSKQRSNMASVVDEFDLEVDLSKSTQHDTKDFQPAPRVTPDDVSGNLKSLHRKLSETLYLIVKTTAPFGKETWRFPEFDYQDTVSANEIPDAEKDNLKLVAETAIRKETGDDCEIFFVGNAPALFLNEKNDITDTSTAEKNLFGTSTFFYRATLLEDIFVDGSFDFNNIVKERITDYAWVTKKDLTEGDILDRSNEQEKQYWNSCICLLEE